MKIIDISQELTKCKVYPGDPAPIVTRLCDMKNNDLYNLSEISLCAHNGTHVDAPLHFINNGKGISEIPLEYFVGECYVITFNGLIGRLDAINILEIINNKGVYERLLIKGDCVVTKEAALVFKESKLKLIGNESQSVGPVNSPMEVHLILLSNNIVLLEGVVLKDVEDGKYFLCAQPLNINNIEGSPCRAILIK